MPDEEWNRDVLAKIKTGQPDITDAELANIEELLGEMRPKEEPPMTRQGKLIFLLLAVLFVWLTLNTGPNDPEYSGAAHADSR